MDAFKQQGMLERKYSRKHAKTILADLFYDNPAASMVKIVEDKLENAPELMQDHMAKFDHEDVLCDLLFWILSTRKTQTIQAVIGQIITQVSEDAPFNLAIGCCHLYVYALSTNPWVKYRVAGKGILFEPLPLPERLAPHFSSHGVPIPMIVRPLKITRNYQSGYYTFNEHIITGGKLKQHDLPAPLAALNRANAVAYRVEPRLYARYKPTFNALPKLSNGVAETPKQIAKRHASWSHLHSTLPMVAKELIGKGNKFYYDHHFDTRYRMYARAYQLSYIGDKYVKALVQFHKKEIITGDW
jgi:hypothetical protein